MLGFCVAEGYYLSLPFISTWDSVEYVRAVAPPPAGALCAMLEVQVSMLDAITLAIWKPITELGF